jgi:LCP family protein required for cell wall assembly
MEKAPSRGVAGRLSRRRLVVIVVAVVVVVGGLVAARFWFAPLGPSLQTAADGSAPLPTWPPTRTPAPGETPVPLPTLAPVALADGSAAPADCGERGVMRLLVLGSDTRSNDYTTGRADFIRAVRADFSGSGVRMLSVPRDLWVSIPNLAAQGITENRVNTAYAYGNYFQLPGGGPTLMADTLRQDLGLEFDHYLVVNFAAVEAGVNAIGGLDLDLPTDIDGTPQGLPYFKAGLNHMEGATLLQYIRVRYIDSDLYRIDRQNQVLLAVRAKLLSPEVVPAIPGLVQALSELVLTDLSPAQLANLACLGRSVGLDHLLSLKIDEGQVTHWTTPEGAAVLLPQYDLIGPIIAAFVAEAPQP